MATQKQIRLEAKQRLSPEALMSAAVIGGRKETRTLAAATAWAQLAKDFKGEGRHDAGAVIALVRDVCSLEGPAYTPLFGVITTLGIRGCKAIADAVQGYRKRADEVQLAKITRLRDKGDHASAEVEAAKLNQGLHCKKQTEAVAEWHARMGGILEGLACRHQLLEDAATQQAETQAAQREMLADTELADKGKGKTDPVAFVRHVWGLSNVVDATLVDGVLTVRVKNIKRTMGKDGLEHDRVKRILSLRGLAVSAVPATPAQGSEALKAAFAALDAGKVAATARHMAEGVRVVDPEVFLL